MRGEKALADGWVGEWVGRWVGGQSVVRFLFVCLLGVIVPVVGGGFVWFCRSGVGLFVYLKRRFFPFVCLVARSLAFRPSLPAELVCLVCWP